MTNQAETSGSSLFQARKTTQNHNYNHNHHLHLHQHRRLHSHAQAEGRQPQGPDGTTPHIRSPPTEKLHDRQVVIVQTVSVVHFIDGSGAVTSTSTLRSDPVAPPSLDTPAGVTVGLTTLGVALPSVSLSGLIPDISDGAPSTILSATTSAEPEPSSSFLSASSETLTSAPFSSSSDFPTLSTGIFNTSSTHFPSLFTNSTTALFLNSTRTSLSSHTTFTSTTKSSSSSTRLTSTTTSDVAAIAGGGSGGGAGVGAGAPAPAAPATDTSSDSGSSGLTPETRNAVVGGVVGSVAGIALIAFAFLFFLRWRKQHGKGIMLLGDGDSTARGRGFTSGSPGSPSSGGGGMTGRSGAFAIPAALANLTGSKRAIEAPAAEPVTQEKGFYRVSGRKLVSVLESGGDGYSDPHDSIGSGTSYFRDSQFFLDDSNDSPLQLGSPMRPVSGVLIMRDGPGRTPVQESAPLPPGYRPSAFPTTLPVPDQVGRSLASRDGSRGSGSRFMEDA